MSAQNSWAIYAILSAAFAALVTILTKIGVRDVPSNLATAIRTGVVLLLAWAIVFARGEAAGIGAISRRSLLFLVLAGLATGASWLCYFAALRSGPTASVSALDKLSLPLIALLSVVLLNEPLGKYGIFGIALIAVGTWLMIQK